LLKTLTTDSVRDPRWWHTLSGYQWFVVAAASAAWLFDNLDQRMFSLVRIPALSSLMHLPGTDLRVQGTAKATTACFLIGWGIGGLILGALGDRFGRARMLSIAILIYSICTGLTAFSRTPRQFAALLFVTGVGIGGVFGLAVSLVAETVGGGARLAVLGILQLLSTVGNVGAALIKLGVDRLAVYTGTSPAQSWRWLFWIGAAPAALAALSGFFLRESDAWLELRNTNTLPRGWVLGSYRELLADRGQRRNLLIGTLLAVTGVVGLWGIGEYAIDLQDAVFTRYYAAAGASGIAAHVSAAKNIAYILQMSGGAAGMLAFTWVAGRFGRRPALIGGFVMAMLSTIFVYLRMNSPADAYWMMPLMGAGQLSVFAGFSIYLPELFGSRTRSTGVSFAYNLGRFAAAAGSFFSAALTASVFRSFASPLPLRYSAVTMCVIFPVGVITACLAPETKDKPLPA
jgi:MFS family permease